MYWRTRFIYQWIFFSSLMAQTFSKMTMLASYCERVVKGDIFQHWIDHHRVWEHFLISQDKPCDNCWVKLENNVNLIIEIHLCCSNLKSVNILFSKAQNRTKEMYRVRMESTCIKIYPPSCGYSCHYTSINDKIVVQKDNGSFRFWMKLTIHSYLTCTKHSKQLAVVLQMVNIPVSLDDKGHIEWRWSCVLSTGFRLYLYSALHLHFYSD